MNLESKNKLPPPYGSVKAFKNFFDMLERRTVDRVTKDIVRKNNLTSKGNEYKLIGGLRFLGLIDKDGYATEKLKGLHFVGKKFTRNLEKVVREAYEELFSDISNLESASRADIINSIMSVYNVRRGTAREAVRVFIYLAKKAEIPLSSKITQKEETSRKKLIKEEAEDLEVMIHLSKILFSAETYNGNFKKGPLYGIKPFIKNLAPNWLNFVNDSVRRDIESALKRKDPEFPKASRDWLTLNGARGIGQFKRLGIFGDWEHSYLTLSSQYEAKIVEIFGKLVEKNYIYRGKKPVYWCSNCGTALAEAEAVSYTHLTLPTN